MLYWPLRTLCAVPVAALRIDALTELLLPNRGLSDADGLILSHMLETHATERLHFVDRERIGRDGLELEMDGCPRALGTVSRRGATS